MSIHRNNMCRSIWSLSILQRSDFGLKVPYQWTLSTGLSLAESSTFLPEWSSSAPGVAVGVGDRVASNHAGSGSQRTTHDLITTAQGYRIENASLPGENIVR